MRVADCFKQIEKRDKDINSFITLCKDYALLKEKQADERKEKLSPLDGMPIAIKDNICTKGIRTTCASKMLENYIPDYSATVVERLENAGLVIIGKTNMDEFGMGSTNETSYFGRVLNPLDETRVAGGSSGGSAAAVAAGFVPFALGSDTGGSTRVPAHFCNVIGFKPSYGALSRFGLIGFGPSFDQIGIITKNVAHAEMLFDIMRGVDNKDMTCIEVEEDFSRDVKIGRAELPYLDVVEDVYAVLTGLEASSNLARFDGIRYGTYIKGNSLNESYEKSRSLFGDEVKRRVSRGIYVSAHPELYKNALALRGKIKEAYDEIFKTYDIIVTPATPIETPKLGQGAEKADLYAVGANLAGLPAITLKGVQLIGRHSEDKRLLKVARLFEEGCYEL